ncbi:MAG: hypothetical protein MJ192_02330 [Clostridia bacterium]|nr:hypothetical protein [Clostridia bacterium]
MKKAVSVLLGLILILSSLPMMLLPVSAKNEGDWMTRRSPYDYDDPENYTPAPGYYYDSEGFHTVSPSYANTTPWFAVSTKDPVYMKDGIHLEFRVDEFGYRGTDPDTGASLGKDEWLSIALWTCRDMHPSVVTKTDEGWLCLLRGEGKGSCAVQSCWTSKSDPDNNITGTFTHKGSTEVEVPIDENGHEHYTLDVEWDGSSYTIKVNDVVVGGMYEIDEYMQESMKNGEAYISIIGQTGVPNGNASISILDLNGSVPFGTDSAEPEPNVLAYGEMTDSSTIPAGQPCFVWDGTFSCYDKLPGGSNLDMSIKGDDSVHIKANDSHVYFNARIARRYTYEAKDFPVIVAMLRNYNGDDGQFWWTAGDILQDQDDAAISWSMWDTTSKKYKVGSDTYNLVCIDMKEYDERWSGRIHGIRVTFTNMVPDDPEYGEFDVMYVACFRSVAEAHSYADSFIVARGGELPTQPAAETSIVTEPASGTVTEADTEVTQDSRHEGTAADTAPSNGGCSSVAGVFAVVPAIAAALILSLKRRKEE